MATSAMITRKRARAETPELTPEMTLEVVLRELRRMREEQSRRETEFGAALRQRDKEVQQLRSQLSQLNNRDSRDSRKEGFGDERGAGGVANSQLGYKLKPDIFCPRQQIRTGYIIYITRTMEVINESR